MVDIQVLDTGDLKRVTRNFSKQADGREMKRELTRGLRDIMRPILLQVKAAYSGGKKLRPKLRRAAIMQVQSAGKTAGARIVVTGRKMPSGMGKIPVYWEGEARWRHPVFGNTAVWVDQAAHPRFYDIVHANEVRAYTKLATISNNVASKLER